MWEMPDGPEGLNDRFKIAANDPDSGINSELRFTIIQGNAELTFLLQEKGANEAESSLVKELDRERKSVCMLAYTIKARMVEIRRCSYGKFLFGTC